MISGRYQGVQNFGLRDLGALASFSRLDLHHIINPIIDPIIKLIGPKPKIHANGAWPLSCFVVIYDQTIHKIKITKDAPAVAIPHLKHLPIHSESDVFNLNRCRCK